MAAPKKKYNLQLKITYCVQEGAFWKQQAKFPNEKKYICSKTEK